mmetsp:Transcript_9481/g.19412  ORF Transcript_9481/g.19412 Transcript_9481/m.19412 type:complete len:89 (+) Transcript_9481:64-330(+)
MFSIGGEFLEGLVGRTYLTYYVFVAFCCNVDGPVMESNKDNNNISTGLGAQGEGKGRRGGGGGSMNDSAGFQGSGLRSLQNERKCLDY